MTITKKLINRRRLLEKCVTSAATLPFVSYLPSVGAAEIAKKRLILMYSPNGTIPDQHFPTGGETDFQFKRITQPLAPHRDDLLILKGLQNTAPEPGDAHKRGMGGLWTASKLIKGEFASAEGYDPVGWSTGISVDQRIANEIGANHRFKSLQYGVRVHRDDVQGRMIYFGDQRPVTPEVDPYKAFDRVFANFSQSTDAEKRAAISASVLDALVGDLNRLRPHLSTEDKIKLERHTESVRAIEKSLQKPDTQSLTCDIPKQGTKLALNTDDTIAQVGEAFMDLIVAAFACDQTPVASLQYSCAVGRARYNHLKPSDSRGHHALSHEPDSNAAALEDLTKINQWYMSQLALFIQKMKDTPDPSSSGSLFDNSLMIYGNSLGKGNTHTRKDLPFVMAGSCQGHFKTGRFINNTRQQNHAKLLTSVVRAYGIEAKGFGDHPTIGELPNLT